MSESGVRGIVIAHGDMATGMIDAVKHIAGINGDFLRPLSNRGLGPDALAQEVRNLAAGEPTIVFTDLQSGSCGFAARRCVQEQPNLVVVSGVNLPILLEFVMRRQSASARPARSVPARKGTRLHQLFANQLRDE
jgi:mannose/fructose-specific phosphotransferase system component IIA